MEKSIAFLLFEDWHGRKEIGSSRIRGHWTMKYMPEAESYIHGKKYEVMIYQKTYWKEYAMAFQGIQILDLCDPDWLEGQIMTELFPKMKAITTITPKMKEAIEGMTNTPVYIIPDRMDLDFFRGYRKKHESRAKSVVWFGYGHNQLLDVVQPYLQRFKLDLYVISDLRPIYTKAKDNIKFDIKTINKEITKHDFVVFPKTDSERQKLKSNNKTLWAWALGMPVAETPEDLIKYLDPQKRQEESDIRKKEIQEKWDIRLSVKELRKIIKKCKE